MQIRTIAAAAVLLACAAGCADFGCLRACGPAEPSPLPTETGALLALFEEAGRVELPDSAEVAAVDSGHNDFNLPWYRVKFVLPVGDAADYCDAMAPGACDRREDLLDGHVVAESLHEAFTESFGSIETPDEHSLYYDDMPSRALRKGYIAFPDGPDEGSAVVYASVAEVPN